MSVDKLLGQFERVKHTGPGRWMARLIARLGV